MLFWTFYTVKIIIRKNVIQNHVGELQFQSGINQTLLDNSNNPLPTPKTFFIPLKNFFSDTHCKQGLPPMTSKKKKKKVDQ